MNDQSKNSSSILARFFHWLFSWRVVHRTLITLACLATLVAVFYTEENWRGKRDWEKCKAELEANGYDLNWKDLIPPPVPDDQNFFKAPGISETNWLGRGAHDLSQKLSPIWQDRSNRLVIAELTVVSAEPAGAGHGEIVLRLNDSAVRTQAEEILRSVLGPSLASAHLFPLLVRPISEIKPVVVKLVADRAPASSNILAVFPTTFEESHLRIAPAGPAVFRITLDRSAIEAADYVRSSDPFEADFDVIREALKRPYTQLPGDYSQPATIPIPNFVTLRAVAQVLADRTRCQLLLGHPDEALRDLTLLRGICRITDEQPTGRPMTLVAAMINVAITGLYVNTIADGLRLHAWKEPQLVAIQEQLAQVNLAPRVAEAFRGERVFALNTYEYTPRSEMVKWFGSVVGGSSPSLGQRLRDPAFLFVVLAPRGWFYQNMVVHSHLSQPIIDAYSATNGVFNPAKTRRALEQLAEFKLSPYRISPYNFLVARMLPNFVRAGQTVAHNQTLANEALIACALERYRLAQGEYPETLDALAPQFIEKLPQDVIDGQSLLYRRTTAGKFLLYSIGWNEKDDGGTTVLNKDGKEDLENGDWVWTTK